MDFYKFSERVCKIENYDVELSDENTKTLPNGLKR
jgi:hypothetical protein